MVFLLGLLHLVECPRKLAFLISDVTVFNFQYVLRQEVLLH